LDADSHTTDVTKWFQIWIGSGDQRLDTFFEVEFAVLRAMVNWRTTVGAVKWNSKNCVLDCSIYSHPESRDTQLIERGIRGWNCVWNGRVTFTFTTADLSATE
jgi:hypothetical protein